MDLETLNATFVIGTFLLLLTGVGPKFALVPFLETTRLLHVRGRCTGPREGEPHGHSRCSALVAPGAGVSIELGLGRPTIKIGPPLCTQIGLAESELPPRGAFDPGSPRPGGPRVRQDPREEFAAMTASE
jgi:hypothetical protein